MAEVSTPTELTAVPDAVADAVPEQHPGRLRSLAARVGGDSLFRSSSLLVIDYLIIGAIGGICSVIAARAWPAYAVGVFGALSGVVQLLSTMTSTGLASTITRFLGNEENQLDFVIEASIVSVLAGVLVSAAVCFIPGHFGIPLHDLPASIGVTFALIVGYVVANNLTAITDPAFIARKETSYAVVKDISASVLRIVILVAFIGTNAVGLFGSFVGYTVVAGVMDLVLIVWKLHNRGAQQPIQRLPHLRKRWRFALTSHSAALVSTAPGALFATIAAAFDGPTVAAQVVIPLTVSAYLTVIPSMTSQALLAELADSSQNAGRVAVRALRMCYAGVLPAVLVLGIAAPWILLIFGHRYSVHSAGYLRWYAASTLLSVSNYVSDTVLLAREKMLAYNIVNGLGAVALLGCVFAAGAIGPYWFGPAMVAGQLLYLSFSFTAVLRYASLREIFSALRTVSWLPSVPRRRDGGMGGA